MSRLLADPLELNQTSRWGPHADEYFPKFQNEVVRRVEFTAEEEYPTVSLGIRPWRRGKFRRMFFFGYYLASLFSSGPSVRVDCLTAFLLLFFGAIYSEIVIHLPDKRTQWETKEARWWQKWPFISRVRPMSNSYPASIAQIARNLFANWIFISFVAFYAAFSTKFMFLIVSIGFIIPGWAPFHEKCSPSIGCPGWRIPLSLFRAVTEQLCKVHWIHRFRMNKIEFLPPLSISFIYFFFHLEQKAPAFQLMNDRPPVLAFHWHIPSSFRVPLQQFMALRDLKWLKLNYKFT